jgi:hypothetical protein
MNKLLVTGLATGIDAGVCQVCNYDLDWMLEYPSLLLWADRLLVPGSIWKVIQNEKFPKPNEVAKCCKLVFDIVNSEGLIEIKKSSPVVDDILREDIFTQVDHDIDQMKQLFPEKISQKNLSKKGDQGFNETIVDGYGYCPPYLWSIYSNLILARLWEANCLFDSTALNFLRFKFGISEFPREADSGRSKSFVTVFKSYLPNEPLLSTYVFHKEGKCKKCLHHKRCEDSYLSDLEKKVYELLKWREYDEFQQAKTVIDSIIEKHESAEGLVDPAGVARDFHDKQVKLQKRVRNIFPKVKRWSNVAAMVSIPVGVASVAAGNSIVSVSSAALFGLSRLGKEYIDLLESKYRWLGFLQNMQKGSH